MGTTDGDGIEIRESTPTVYERSLLCRRVNEKRKYAREDVFCLKIQCSVKLKVTFCEQGEKEGQHADCIYTYIAVC